MKERRHVERRKFGYYMPLVDNVTGDLIGHLADVSQDGFRIDTSAPIPEGKILNLCLTLTGEVSRKPSMSFHARAKWCQSDDVSPNSYYVGFELTEISRENIVIYQKIVETYGL